jgi:hypothetical protein
MNCRIRPNSIVQLEAHSNFRPRMEKPSESLLTLPHSAPDRRQAAGVCQDRRRAHHLARPVPPPPLHLSLRQLPLAASRHGLQPRGARTPLQRMELVQGHLPPRPHPRALPFLHPRPLVWGALPRSALFFPAGFPICFTASDFPRCSRPASSKAPVFAVSHFPPPSSSFFLVACVESTDNNLQTSLCPTCLRTNQLLVLPDNIWSEIENLP